MKYIADFLDKPKAFCYLLDRVTNENPYLFDCDGNSKDVNKKVWFAKQIFPSVSPPQVTYFKTLKGAKAALNRWGAKWARV
jgi:hypothetical protein